MTRLEAAIEATVNRMRSTDFERHSNDCDAIMADYVKFLTGLDPMAEWRDKYHDDEGAEAFIREAGGNLELVRKGFKSIGVKPSALPPKRGDVVVIDYHGEQVTGLYLDPFTALKSAKGVRQSKYATIMEAWTCA